MRQDSLIRIIRPCAVGALLSMTALLGCASDTTLPGGNTTTVSNTGGSGGEGGTGGGDGGAGGEVYTGPCDRDCSKIETLPCKKAVCNEGQLDGPVGLCIVVNDDGTTCDDGLFCTVNDTCSGGQCVGGPQNDCGLTPATCNAVVCDESSKTCVEGTDTAANGTPCTPADLCQTLGTCQNGTCNGLPKDCSFSPFAECNSVACNPANGQCEPTADTAKNGNACSLTGDLCMVGRTCNNGQCLGGTARNCSGLTFECSLGVCNAQNGLCVAQNVPQGGSCAEAADSCNAGVCDAAGTCAPVPLGDGTACSDFDRCTANDTCSAGGCDGTPIAGCAFYLEEHFEFGCPPSGWTLAGDWECGMPRAVGPTSAYDGNRCVATKLATNYSNNQTYTASYVQTPPINLTTATNPGLRFAAFIATEGGTADGVNLKVSTNGGTTWTVVTGVRPAYNLTVNSQTAWGGANFTGGGWRLFDADLSPYVGQTISLRFSFRSDTSVNDYAGIYIDDVLVGEKPTLPLAITTTELPRAPSSLAYTTTLRRVGGSAAATWSIVGGSNHDWLTVNPTTGVLSGDPSTAQLGPFMVTLRVEEPGVPGNADQVVLTNEVVPTIFAEGFEVCPNGWTFGGDWQCGAPTSGPNAAYSGSNVLATQLATNYNYNQAWATTIATSPAINLTNVQSAHLTFRAWVHSESSVLLTGYDGANLKISTDGTTYTTLTNVSPGYTLTLSSQPAWGGNQSALGYQLFSADLSAYAGQTIRLRFAFYSDGLVNLPGFYIDDILITE
ncbi:choice-of-anchor J domain-containing protein [Chondromyces crocatus]|uniref:Staphylococcus aureus surface protein A n=1 Tax=Chondromyces crocatus TaxID=52 RepID=A0A0K1E9L7_CHOCO|nr:choice-of-anchor J domain-containing protein [Chondromyces crocatus]AKT37278.1 uncharacterized protein CMC5_014090 [Chondromyces crocatus]